MEADKNETTGFELHSGAIQNRIRNVFGCLDELEVKHKAFEQSRAEEDAESDRHLIRQGPSSEEMETINAEFKHPGTFSGRDYHSTGKGGRHGHTRIGHNVEFKKPVPPPTNSGPGRRQPFRGRYGRGRACPDYKVHPEKWTEYSLEDVDLSDSANRKAAFSFLQERRAAKETEMKDNGTDLETSACSRGQFLFKKPNKHRTVENKQDKALEKQQNLTFANMESDNDTDPNNIEMEDMESKSRPHVTEELRTNATSLKRKMEEIDEDNSCNITDLSEKQVEFKSRKVSKRQIRNRREGDEDSD